MPKYTLNPFISNFDAIQDVPLEMGKVTNEPTGFPDRTTSTITFSDSTPDRTFSIQPTGANFEFYEKGKKYKSTGDTVQITDVEGEHFIYYDDGTLTSTMTFIDALITDYPLVGIIYWDATNSKQIILGDERHGMVMDGQTHLYLHEIFGAQWQEGLGFADFIVDGNGSLDTHAQFSVDNGEFDDEDIHFVITDGSPQDLDPIAQIPVFYREGATPVWRTSTADDFAILHGGGGLVAWNEFTGGSWQQTEASTTNFVLTHVFATHDVDEPVLAIQGINEYTTKTLAQAGAETEITQLALTNLPSIEWCPLGTVIYQTKSTFSNAAKAIIVSTNDGDNYVDLRLLSRGFAAISAGGGGVTDHGGLTGLSDATDHAAVHFDRTSDFLNASVGAGSAGSPILLDAAGHVDATMINDVDIDHNALTNTHNLTTDIDHDTLTNTHNLTTDIDHDTIINTHNLTTDINHNSITNTHNLTTDIDHNQLTNYALNEHFTEVSIDHTNIIAGSGSDHSDVALNTTHRSSDGKNHSDVVLNNTHRGSDGKNHSDVVLNNTHRTSDGSDHTFINQNVTTTGTPSFAQLDVDNVQINGNSIISTDAAGDLNLIPDTTGDLVLDGLKWPQADGTANYVLETDGSGQLSWVAQSGGGGTPGGSDTQLQYNDGGSFGGLSTLTWDDTDFLVGAATKLQLRSSSNYINSPSANNIEIIAGALVTIGPAGDILLGDGTVRILRPHTNQTIDIGDAGYMIRDFYLGGTFYLANGSVIQTGSSTGGSFGSSTTNKISLFGVTPVVQPTALTSGLTEITHTSPGTPDYALQNMTNSGPWGFKTQDEANTLLSVVLNNQVRIDELETKLQALGAIA